MITAVPKETRPVKVNPVSAIPVERPDFFRVSSVSQSPSREPSASTDFRPRWWPIGQSN